MFIKGSAILTYFKMKTSRELRCEPQKWEIDKNKEGVLKFKDGMLKKNVHVEGCKLVFTCNRPNAGGCYPDDMLATIRDIYLSFGTVDTHTQTALLKIQEAINMLDQRAVEKHGYSNSKEEMNYVPPYLKK